MTAIAQPMIFVTGASRSGTTLMCHALGRHSAIAGLREMQYFGESWSRDGTRRDMTRSEARRAVSSLVEHQDQGVATSSVTEAAVDRIMTSLIAGADNAEVFASTLRYFARQSGKSIACEQTPRNIYYAAALLEIFPNARFIHMLRDPRAVTASQKSRWRKRALLENPSRMSRLGQSRAWFNYHPYTVAQLWNRATAEALRLQSHPRFRTVRFEDLVARPEQVLEELSTFLGLDYEKAMLNVEHINSSYVASTGRQTGFSQSAVESWRSALTDSEAALIARHCKDLMLQAGYEPGSAPVTRRGRTPLALRYLLHVAGALALNPRRVAIQARSNLMHLGNRRAHRQSDAGKTPAAAGKNVTRFSPPTAKQVFGLPFMDMSLQAAADHLVSRAEAGISCRVAFVNAHCLNRSVGDPELLKALREADTLFADGIGMQLASRLHGQRLVHNVNGTDLFPYICDRAEAAGVGIGLFGGERGVADRCKEVLLRNNPKLRVTYVNNGFIDPGAEAGVIEAINSSDTSMLFVALGVPRQEQWVRHYGNNLKAPVVISVGGLLDFVSGRVPRAPMLMRKLGVEWLFRLSVEPRRLFRRYVIGNPVFLARAIRFAATGRLWPEDSPGISERAS